MRHLNCNRQHGNRKSSRSAFFSLLAPTIALILSSGFLAFAQDDVNSGTNNNVRAIRLSDVEGTVQMLDANGVVFDQAHPNMPVTQGMHLKTGSDGRIEVQFEDGSVARITPNSELIFSQLQRSSEGDTVTQLKAVGGLTYYEINNRGGSYTVLFGPYIIHAEKNSIFRVGLDQNPAQLAVMQGQVHVETGNTSGVEVKKGHTGTLDLHDASSYDVAQGVSDDSWDQWNADRDQYLSKIGSHATMARADSGNPDDPAWNDLDYYGNWYDMPGYGMGWMPAGVGAGWDPFGSGYWGYYPSFGYTWISSNPWGWYPYHCGAWNWFSGPGWMWFPGNCGWGAFGRGWYPVTTVWNVPPNYSLPMRPKSQITPVRGAFHMPPQQALISVSRGVDDQNRYRTFIDHRPVATPIKFDGRSLPPIESTVHPHSGGPLGEGFRASSGAVSGGIPAQGFRSGAVPFGEGGGTRSTYMPVQPGVPRGNISVPQGNTFSPPRMSAPPPRMSAPPPSFHPSNAGGGMSAPHMSAPSASAASAPHMSAPAAAPSGGGHR